MTDRISRSCPAKVNFFLRVLAREADGYHGIETLFCRIDFADELVVERTADGITLDVEGADLGPPERNLVWQAADLALAQTGRRFGVHLALTKRVPAGAGLGGGSSDAAAALHAVNQLAGGAIPAAELLHLGRRLGADVPFFVSDAPLALGWGHGERLFRLAPLPERPMLLVLPEVHVATADAYARIDAVRAQAGPRGSLLLDAGALGNWSDIARMAGNDFEAAIFAAEPRVRAAFEALATTAPMLCRMSGSGSALVAVYRTERDRDDAAMMLGSRHGRVVATRPA
jgi:4-diphosphocytidyl-2-C-methyl-D-erythritol kinase